LHIFDLPFYLWAAAEGRPSKLSRKVKQNKDGKATQELCKIKRLFINQLYGMSNKWFNYYDYHANFKADFSYNLLSPKTQKTEFFQAVRQYFA